MTIFDVGRVCVKIAGRDAGKYCVVVKAIDAAYVEIDGQTRRRKCNISHLEPLNMTVDIKADADNKTVAAALTKAGFETKERTSSKKSVGDKPVKQRNVVEKIADTLSSKATGAQKQKVSDEVAEEKPKAAKKEKTDSKKSE